MLDKSEGNNAIDNGDALPLGKVKAGRFGTTQLFCSPILKPVVSSGRIKHPDAVARSTLNSVQEQQADLPDTADRLPTASTVPSS